MFSLRSAVIVVLGLLSASCQLEKVDPGTVGEGVARLSVRTVAATTAIISADKKCGFESPGVLAKMKIEGEAGGQGSATWKVEGCELDFGEMTSFGKDCSGVETTASGKVTISGTKVLKGTVTDNPVNPIIPANADAVKIELKVVHNNFTIRQSSSTSALKHISGEMSWVSQPHLAVSKSAGLCTIATSDLTISDVQYKNERVFVDTKERRFEVEVTSSAFGAQLGKYGDKENSLEGKILVWGMPVSLPPRDKKGIDPTYDAAAFRASFACKEDLKTPVEYTCGTLVDRVAQGAAQLTVDNFGNFASMIDEDKGCGFQSPAVAGAPVLSGPVGGPGSATFTISTPCRINLVDKTAIKTDCHGVTKYMQGVAVVTGTKVIRGLITGDPASPIVPTTRDAAEVVIDLSFENFKVSDSIGEQALTVVSGRLTGRALPRLALDTVTGACSLKTGVAEFKDVKWENAQLKVFSSGNTFAVAVASANLNAVAGAKDGVSNFLAGSIVANGVSLPIPVKGEPILDPGYDAAHYEASFSCAPGMKIPLSDAECSFEKTLAESAARLLVMAVGTGTSMVNANTDCGFDNTLLKLSPDEVIGEPGEMGMMSWSISGCKVGQAAVTVNDTNCSGGKRYTSGFATFNAKRIVTGEREKQLLIIDSIIPRSRDAVVVKVNEVKFNNWSAYSIAGGATAPAGKLILHTGKATGTVRPILGERASASGTFDVPTSVASFSDIVATNVTATLQSGAKTFKLNLPEVKISALNGSYLGSSNTVTGTVKLGDSVVQVGPIPLDPAFQQAAFDASYVCTPDLKSVIPPN